MNLFEKLWVIYDAMAYSADAAEYGKKGAIDSRELRHVAFFPVPEEHKANRAIAVFRKAAQRDRTND